MLGLRQKLRFLEMTQTSMFVSVCSILLANMYLEYVLQYYNIMFMYILVYSISYLFILIYCLFFTIVAAFCNITVLWLLWQRNFPICGTIKEF